MEKIFGIDSYKGTGKFYIRINEEQEKLLRLMEKEDCFEMEEVTLAYDCKGEKK